MKNLLYWMGNVAVGLTGIAITFSDKIIPAVFPERTLIHQLALPVAATLKFLWDSWKYRKGTIAPHAKELYDKAPNRITGKYNSKNLPSGLSKDE